MDVNALIILGAAGLAAGFIIPKTVHWIIDFKIRAKGMPSAREEGFSRIFSLFLCLLNTVVWALAGLLMDSALSAAFASILFTTAVVIALIDLRIRLIPNELVLLLLIVGAAYQVADYGLQALPGSLLCMLGMMALFAAAAGLVGFDKVGAGDLKLAGAMGLTLGYPNVVIALVVLCTVLLLYSLCGLTVGRLTLKSMLPLGPFMMTGMAVALLCAIFRVTPSLLAAL